jgi:hypothetical protein
MTPEQAQELEELIDKFEAGQLDPVSREQLKRIIKLLRDAING